MTPLRRKMIDDMKLAGLVPGTQQIYIGGVRALAAFYRRPPDTLSEDEVERYLLHRPHYSRNGACRRGRSWILANWRRGDSLVEERHVARGTFKTARFALQFLYRRTLGREWDLFVKKRSAHPDRSVCHKPFPTRMCVAS